MKGIKQLIVAITVTASLLVAVPTSQATDMVWESNTFDTDTGAWFGYNNTANGQNVQWLNSNLAGGTAGELGGSVTRSTSVSFYARNLDVNIDFNQPMHWRGTFSANSDLLTTWNMSVYIGYFNLNEALSGSLDNFIGWRSREPSTPDGLFRARARIAVQSNLSSDYVLPQSVGIPFDAEWIPNGDGSGTFQGTLGDPANREHEPWVLSALGFINHPLRARTAERHVREGLDLLEEIQRTGDIFFPLAWLHALLDGHASPAAAEAVRQFLDAHPDYPPRLRAKVLQAADGLFRAATIRESDEEPVR